MVIGLILLATIIGKIAEETILRRDGKMSGKLVKVLMRMVMRRINMIRTDIKMIQARKVMAMQVIRMMESARSRLPMGLRKIVAMEIMNLKRNVSAMEGLQKSLIKEMKFLKSKVKALKTFRRK